MPAHTYQWLSELLAVMLPDLEDMPKGAKGQEFARKWFSSLLRRFSERGLTTPYQQRNHVVSTRHEIRARFGDDHPALEIVGFDEPTWQQINQELSDRMEARSENQRLLDNPDGIVAKGESLLDHTTLPELACGLAVATGRRFSELLSGQSRYEPASVWSVYFTGQRKHKGDPKDFCFEIPTLVSAAQVLNAWGRLLKLIGAEILTPHSINNRFNHMVNAAAERHFRGLVPPRLPAAAPGEESTERDPHARERKADAIYLHLFRAVYATIAVHWYCPPRVNRITYKAEIQGHRQILEAADGKMRRSYAASRHYDDYQIGDGKGNIDGRQGIKLGTLPGLEILTIFRRPGKGEDVELTDGDSTDGISVDVPVTIVTPPISPSEPETSMPPKTPTRTPEAAPAPVEAAPAAAPVPVTEKAPAKPKSKPGLYRIHPDDKARLEESRTKVEDLSQPDHLRSMLELAARAATFQDAAQRTDAAEARIEQERQRANELAARLEAQTQESKRLSDILRAIRPQAADFAPLAGVAKELLDLALSMENGAVRDKLLSLASRTLGGMPAPTEAATPAKTSESPRAATRPAVAPRPAATPSPEPRSSPSPAAGQAEPPSEEANKDAEGTEDKPPVTAKPAPAHTHAASARGRKRLDQAVKSIMDFNDQQQNLMAMWAITPSTIAKLTGANRELIRSYFAQNAERIKEHHERHGITERNNYLHGSHKEKIEDVIDATPATTNAGAAE